MKKKKKIEEEEMPPCTERSTTNCHSFAESFSEFFVSTKSAFTAEILICNTEMRLGPISIIYAFVL